MVCHTGKFQLFGEKIPKGFLYEIKVIINQNRENVGRFLYFKTLSKSIIKVVQKVGEEAVELGH